MEAMTLSHTAWHQDSSHSVRNDSFLNTSLFVIPGEQPSSVIPGEQPPSVIPGEQPPSVIPGEQPSSVIPSERSDEGSLHIKRMNGLIPMNKHYYVYLLTNWNNRLIYTGVTSDLTKRLYEHKHKLVAGFTNKYNINKLVYFEQTSDVLSAIHREKEIKGWRREKKNRLVETMNPENIMLKVRNIPIITGNNHRACLMFDRRGRGKRGKQNCRDDGSKLIQPAQAA